MLQRCRPIWFHCFIVGMPQPLQVLVLGMRVTIAECCRCCSPAVSMNKRELPTGASLPMPRETKHYSVPNVQYSGWECQTSVWCRRPWEPHFQYRWSASPAALEAQVPVVPAADYATHHT
jgi:hypothetical protein